MKTEKYQLRRAAGLYWLLDMEQPGIPYRRPISMNESGAWIWENLSSGVSAEELAVRMSSEYGLETEEAKRDILVFMNQLRAQGVEV